VSLDSTPLLPPFVPGEISTRATPERALETSGRVSDAGALRMSAGVSVWRGASAALGHPTSSLHTRQLWEGKVTAVGSGEFVAIVQDRTDPKNGDEEVVFGIEEVSDADHSLLKAGASFYWVIGFERTPAGQQKNVSMICFRRLPALSQSPLSRAEKRANELLSLLRPTVDEPNESAGPR
jgi:hypothetical protein